MYFVDRNKIISTLKHLDELLSVFESKQEWLNDDISKLALQRIAHNTVEALMDVGNLIIDGFIMRDPGSYEDIIDILIDEKVVSIEMETPLKNVVDLRKIVVREYVDADNEVVEKVLKENLASIKQFSSSVINYLENELGPVSAFLPESEK
ncbi:hypothetical protein CD30_04950 [Ureibacillus massiliensis 4400831 = CIP 108448 = CCUG 49529]|uniref:DUF86 domain-containing protein n=1 Tax=Ureibacillus massiliensis 4400831 = CIP 108448 = CCUG 49529 TaxID=1211035 RepID=A0A0A3J902_9BACL|nr:DUF86 domain-containing protein [Ureibacillus massiliensis]KGR91658.1 hypothetical protein CD30_04950 [Ureibacillus massiliensis 4400831 = CIP 108448 = CCUG 49529]